MYYTRSEEGGSGISHVEDPSPGTDLIRDTTQRSAGGVHNTSSLNASLGYADNVGQEEETHSENVGSDADELPFEASLLGWMKRSVGPSHGWYPGLISKIHLVILLLIGHALGTSLGKDCVFLKQWKFSMPVKNIKGNIIMIMFLLILGANGKDYDVRNMKNSLVSPKEVLQISDNVVPPDFSYTYVYFNMGNTAFVCSKEFAERNASCRIRPYTSTSCQGWQGVSNGSTWYLAFNESKMPDFSKLLYCIYQAVPEELTLYQGSISRTPVDGGWGNWSSLGICSATCGGGRQYWHRKCNSPIPKYGGLDCSGESLKEQSCNNNSKCPIDGGWGEWTNWSNYSAISGGESRFRNRSCSDPTPKYGGSNCSGKSSEEQICMIQDCPNPWKIGLIIVLVLVLSALIVIGIIYYLWQKEKGNGAESTNRQVKYQRSRVDNNDSTIVDISTEHGSQYSVGEDYSSRMSALPRPQMRGLLKSFLTRHFIIGATLSVTGAALVKVFLYDARKKKYADFYKTYDAQADFERMRELGVFQSARPLSEQE
ncbi:uncharacterized protein LOC121431145 [Lytechinus variegatus]|uniref:uncharacterized protein LOC121431145 n=1 Tax=Lytechinus variegatus TaxID=7654 RepID=UPI001BB216AE|nr:uncharacterized protein LOC121431145 [Lytechinus variegatus]